MSTTADEAAKASGAAVVKTLAPEVMKRVEELTELQVKFDDEYKKYVVERQELERKYIAVYDVLYKQRADVITGAGDATKGIADFWLQALQNQPRVGRYIEEHDEEALKALKNITIEYVDDFNGFKLIFHFAPNDFFTNETLVKTFHIPHMMGGKQGSEPVVDKVEGTEISWKDDKNLTEKRVKKTTKKKGKKTTTTKVEPQESFFTFFDAIDLEEEPETYEEAMAMQAEVQTNLGIGFAIRDKILPRAVHWFTGEAVDDDSDADDDDEDDDYDDEEGDEDDDEDESEEDAPRKGKGGGGKGKGGGKKAIADDEDEETDDEEDDEEARAALAAAFKKSVKVDKKGGEKAPKGADGKDGEKPPECKQQ